MSVSMVMAIVAAVLLWMAVYEIAENASASVYVGAALWWSLVSIGCAVEEALHKRSGAGIKEDHDVGSMRFK